MSILLLGSTGQLGRSFVRLCANCGLKHSVFMATRFSVDLSYNYGHVYSRMLDLMRYVRPCVIINCAAYTDVGAAETPHGKELAHRINGESVKALAEAYVKMNKDCLFIHISTDYVYSGNTQPISVNNVLENPNLENPLSEYGKSKLEGDRNLINTCKKSSNNANCIIIRTSGLYSTYPGNIYSTICSSTKNMIFYSDVYTVPTYTLLLANVLQRLSINWIEKTNKFGKVDLLHVVPDYSEPVSWFLFANAVVAENSLPISIESKLYDKKNTHAPLNKYSVLKPSGFYHPALEHSIQCHHWRDYVSFCAENRMY